MTVSANRILLMKAAIAQVQKAAQAPEVATPAQIAAGFAVAKAGINAMVQQLVPPWAMGMVEITDEEIHTVSDAVANAVVNS
jgi:hypothetical protein